ncbi:CapA family protein [Streptomyces sp. LUP47B]|uniref:CapA family protein n=1 Tax=Streptomyces sp. LUP47B TaxID=1890286 RepID=UPI000851F6BA|nr:CapA family protein [Streptomyces sp. LUP47B]
MTDGRLSDSWRLANVHDGFTLTAVGDLVVDDALAPLLETRSPGLLDLLRSADVTFGNFESTAVDLTDFDGWPEAESGGSWLISTSRVPADLRRIGFDLMARANNHTTDWGVAGMRSTDRLLTEAGIVHAGTGDTLADARSPRFLTTPAGRVSLVSVASRFEPMSRAADPLGRVPGRPGVNALRTTRHVLVAAQRLRELALIRDALPPGSVRASVLAADRRDGTVTLFGTRYAAKPGPGPHTDAVEFHFVVHESDRDEVLHAVRQAKQTSDFTIATMHTHEPGNYSQEPPDFLPLIARETIDNGADAFLGHGPHQLRGIEVYRGRPIYYSLGNFIFMENTQQPLTPGAYDKDGSREHETEAEFLERKRVHGVFGEQIWYESVVAVSRFDGDGALRAVELHPIELHWDGPRDADRGIPRLADRPTAERILLRLQRLSKPLGTQITIREGIGHLSL